MSLTVVKGLQSEIFVPIKMCIRDRARIVFVTAYSEYAVAAFELGVVDYVLKPYEKGRLKKVLDLSLIHI